MNGAAKAFGERLLAERAQRLAARPARDDIVERRRICVCEAGGALYGLAVDDVARVIASVTPAPLANADPSLLGIISRGGGFALVRDLAALMGAAPAPRNAEGHLILLRRLRPLTALKVTRTIAIDDIEILSAEEAASLPARAGVGGYGRHADNRIVSIIDISALLQTGAHEIAGG